MSITQSNEQLQPSDDIRDFISRDDPGDTIARCSESYWCRVGWIAALLDRHEAAKDAGDDERAAELLAEVLEEACNGMEEAIGWRDALRRVEDRDRLMKATGAAVA